MLDDQGVVVQFRTEKRDIFFLSKACRQDLGLTQPPFSVVIEGPASEADPYCHVLSRRALGQLYYYYYCYYYDYWRSYVVCVTVV